MPSSKQYGLKIIHKPSQTIVDETWFNTFAERQAAMGRTQLLPHHIFFLEEKPVDSDPTKRDEWIGPR